MGWAARSTDPRLRAPQFQEHQEHRTLRALEDMRLQSETKVIPQPTPMCSTPTSLNWLRHHPCPPTPPRPSQKRLDDEGGESHWDDNGDKLNIPPTAVNNTGWDDNGIDGDDEDTTSNEGVVDEEAAARDGSQVGDGELKEGMADDRTKGEDSPQSNRLYTQEGLVILTRKIFGDEDEEEDAAFWDADEAPRAAIDHPAKHEGSGVMDQQDKESDTGGQSGEGNADEASKLDGLFGPTSSTATDGLPGLPRSNQDEDDDQNAGVLQDVLETAASSAHVDTSDGDNSSENDIQRTTTASRPLTSLESPRTALSPSPPTQRPLPPENGVGIHSTKDDTPIGNLQPGELPEAGAGANEGRSDPVPVPATQVDPPAVVAPSEEKLHFGAIRRVIRMKRLPEFSPTRPGIFSTLILNSGDDASLGKRKRSQEDDGDEREGDSSPASIPQRDRQVLHPWYVAQSSAYEQELISTCLWCLGRSRSLS